MIHEHPGNKAHFDTKLRVVSKNIKPGYFMNHLLRPQIWSSFPASSGVGPCDVPFRYASEPIPRYRGTVARWHAHLCGLATATHETSGLAKNRQPPAVLLHKDKALAIDRLSRRMSFDQFQHVVVILASGCCTHFPTDVIRNLLPQILLHPLNNLKTPRQGDL